MTENAATAGGASALAMYNTTLKQNGPQHSRSKVQDAETHAHADTRHKSQEM